MLRQVRTAILMLAVMTAVTGVLYPLVITGIAQAVFAHSANGSFILDQGIVVGSELIGQPFSGAGYFWPRPSATPRFPYNSAASSGSNLGPLSREFERELRDRVSKLRDSDPANRQPIPPDLVTASGSGLDPHISPEAARWQAARVARARGIAYATVAELIERHTEHPQLGILGEARVNVVLLNHALDDVK